MKEGISLISIPSCGLYEGKIYELTSEKKCKCGNVFVSYGVKANGGKLTCHKCFKNIRSPLNEYYALRSDFSEIGTEVLEAVEELKEELEVTV